MQVSVQVTVESAEELAVLSQVLQELSRRMGPAKPQVAPDGVTPGSTVTREDIELLRGHLTENARRALKTMAERALADDGFVAQEELAKAMGGVTPNTLSGWLQSLYFASRRRNIARDQFYSQGRRQGVYGYRMERDVAGLLSEGL